MKKITQELILEKKQHLHILNLLVKHIPHGLTLHELSYLLTINNNMYQMSILQERFGKNRNNVFKTRQRIHDCLTDLLQLKLINKKGKMYYPNIFEFHLLFQRVKLRNNLKEIEQQQRAEYKEIEEIIKNISDDERKDYESEFLKVYGKNIFKPYLTKS